MPLPAPIGSVSVANVAVAPPGVTKDVVRGVTFELAPGESLAIVGPSASGKSTLVRALIGVWPLLRGIVRLDGADIAQYDRTELGKYLGYLPQDVELFDGTVAENIARMTVVDSEAVVKAARLAGVHDLILQLPNGYDTRIGQGGQSLSGGQRQRIGLARAVYGNPRLVVLDEPNSNLDHAGEAALAEAMTVLRATGATIIVVTHRPSILTGMDKILVMNNGAMERFGPREDVMAAILRPVAAPAQRPAAATPSTAMR